MNAQIDSEDDLITFNEAAAALPEHSRPSLATWWRWWRHGVRGVKLRTWLCGGRRYTTRGAVRQFITELTAAASGAPLPIRTPRQRQQAIEVAERELGQARHLKKP